MQNEDKIPLACTAHQPRVASSGAGTSGARQPQPESSATEDVPQPALCPTSHGTIPSAAANRNMQSDAHESQTAPCPSSSSSVPATESSSASVHAVSLPIKGDGRCFFRAIAVSLNQDLQVQERDPVTGEIVDPIKALQETACADNMRSKVISHMCETLDIEPGSAVLSADMPVRLTFDTLAERIFHMSDTKSLVGELEIQATSEVLKAPLHVMIDGSDHISRYVPVHSEKDSILVKYIPNNDAGHYVPMVTTQRTDSHPVKLTDLSPLPLSGVARKQRQSGPKTILLTGSPYKKVLEEKQLKKGKAALKRSSTKATCKNPPKKMNKGKSKKKNCRH